jgi:peptidoglycan/xylan/chitin deacetylase (PgdA/CDA1 family)
LTVAILFLIVLAAIVVYYGIPLAYSGWSRIALRRTAVARSAVVLTLDDGPGSDLTPAILDILAARRMKATFFILGRNIPGREDLLRRIAVEGHQIGSHGYTHINYWKVSPWRAISDIRQGWHAINGVLGASTTYPFRPPYGKLTILCLLYLWLCRVPIVYWTIDSGDTWMPPARRDGHRAATVLRRHRGGVILAHDFDRQEGNARPFVLGAVNEVLAVADEEHMAVLTVSDLLKG